MHHRLVANSNVGYVAQSTSLVDDNVLNIILMRTIRDGVNLTFLRVGLGMRGETGGQGSEIVRPNRVQFIGNLVGRAPPSTVARIRPA
jgi:hypothetical protein